MLHAQGLHFSQYYNAPPLLNPANTALYPMEDFSLGVNYRDQWANIPAPFKTIAAHGDWQMMRNNNITNWLGMGLAFYSDKAGDGLLSMNKIQASLAYHVQLDDWSMLSGGVSVAYAHRQIDFARLTFDVQWDGFKFDRGNPNQEPFVRKSTSYADIMLGLNYAYFPNEDFYIKVGAGLMHINRPVQSFYEAQQRIGMRPIANVDMLWKTAERFIVNPSIYYSYQSGASELIFGSTFNTAVGEMGLNNALIYGLYYRMGESFIPVLGMEFNQFKIMFSYDITTSPLSTANRSMGAAELGIVFKGFYSSHSRGRDGFNCPRF